MGEICGICQRKQAGDADPNKHYVTPNQSWAGAPVNDLCWASIFAEASAECYRLGYERSQAALAAARRECEEANARCAMLDGHFSDAVRVAQEARADLAIARTVTRNLINAAEALREGMIPTLYDEDLTKSRTVEHLRKLPALLNASAKAAAEARAALAAPAAGEEGT